MPKFRRATVEDLEEVFSLIKDCWGKHGDSYNGIQIDDESTVATASRVIKHGICLIGRGAVAGGMIVSFPWNYNVKVGSVLFWNFTKPKGALIFPAICKEFKTQGATHIGCSSHFPDNRIDDWYAKFGLTKAEKQFITDIKEMKALTYNGGAA